MRRFPPRTPKHLYDAATIAALAEDFPEGCFVGLVGDRPVAMGLGMRVTFDFDDPHHTIADLVHGGGRSGHHPSGDWYYGTTIAVRPECRRRGIGAELYGLRKGVCRRLGLAGIVAGGTIPGFADHKHRMSADEYIDEVRSGHLYDPTLSFQLENGFEARCALPGYVPDPKVEDHAVLIVWRNPDTPDPPHPVPA